MTRIVTAAVLIAIAAGALLGPTWLFFAVVLLVAAGAWNEFANLAASAGARPFKGFGLVLAVGCAASFRTPEVTPLVVGGAFLLGSVMAIVASVVKDGSAVRTLQAVAATIGGCIWIGVMLGAQIGIRQYAHGVVWLSFVWITVAAGDIGAYYGGKQFGRTPLAPTLSPKKTRAGAVAGLLMSAAAGELIATLADFSSLGLGVGVGAGLGAALGAIGQCGDLMESALKRAAATKDSSNLLPGHGGIFDRIDGQLPAGLALYLLLTSSVFY